MPDADFEIIKESIYETAEIIFHYTPNARLHLLEHNYEPGRIHDIGNRSFYRTSNGSIVFRSKEEVKAVLDTLVRRETIVNSSCYLSDTIKYIADFVDVGNDKLPPSFVFTFFDENKVHYRFSNGRAVIDRLENLNIDVIAVSNFFNSPPPPDDPQPFMMAMSGVMAVMGFNSNSQTTYATDLTGFHKDLIKHSNFSHIIYAEMMPIYLACKCFCC